MRAAMALSARGAEFAGFEAGHERPARATVCKLDMSRGSAAREPNRAGTALEGALTNMQIPLQITFRGMDPSDAIANQIRDKARRLERFHGRITSCRVVVDAPHRHHYKGVVYRVNVDLSVPGGEIVASRERGLDHAHEDVHVAIRDAFAAAIRQLEDHSRRKRGDVKTHEAQLEGRVVRLDPWQGFGFIETSDGIEVYFHRNAVIHDGFTRLEIGDPVRLLLADNESPNGPQATTVDPLVRAHVSA